MESNNHHLNKFDSSAAHAATAACEVGSRVCARLSDVADRRTTGQSTCSQSTSLLQTHVSERAQTVPTAGQWWGLHRDQSPDTVRHAPACARSSQAACDACRAHDGSKSSPRSTSAKWSSSAPPAVTFLDGFDEPLPPPAAALTCARSYSSSCCRPGARGGAAGSPGPPRLYGLFSS